MRIPTVSNALPTIIRTDKLEAVKHIRQNAARKKIILGFGLLCC